MRFTPGVRRGEDIMTSVLTRNGRLRVWVVPTLVVLIVVCAAAAMLIGRFSVSLEDVVAALRARFWGGPAVPPRVNSVVFDLRAPRIIVAILIGGGLSVAGASFQSLFSNPLATPDTLGVAAGTCVGAVIALLLDWNLIGVQAAGAAGMKASIEAGHVVSLDTAKTIADGIAVKKPGELTFELCSRYLDEIVTVDDDEIAQAILFLMERGKMVAEGAGAAPVAAIMNRKFDVSGKVAAVISGGNIDVTMISRIIEKGLLRAGRMTKLRILMQDRPGQLEMASRIIAAEGANVMVVHHDRTDVDLDIRDAILEITMETQDRKHAQRVIDALRAGGFQVS